MHWVPYGINFFLKRPPCCGNSSCWDIYENCPAPDGLYLRSVPHSRLGCSMLSSRTFPEAGSGTGPLSSVYKLHIASAHAPAGIANMNNALDMLSVPPRGPCRTVLSYLHRSVMDGGNSGGALEHNGVAGQVSGFRRAAPPPGLLGSSVVCGMPMITSSISLGSTPVRSRSPSELRRQVECVKRLQPPPCCRQLCGCVNYYYSLSFTFISVASF